MTINRRRGGCSDHVESNLTSIHPSFVFFSYFYITQRQSVFGKIGVVEKVNWREVLGDGERKGKEAFVFSFSLFSIFLCVPRE